MRKFNGVIIPSQAQLNRGPVGNHGVRQLIPTKLPPQSMPPEGQSFTGPVDVRQPRCPSSIRKPSPDRMPDNLIENVTENVLISPGRQLIVIQEQGFDLFPMLVLNGILQDRCYNFEFNNSFRNPQTITALPSHDALPVVRPIKDPPPRRPTFGHVPVANELPVKEGREVAPFERKLLRIDTGFPKKIGADIVDTFEPFEKNGGGDAGADITLGCS